jgi:hypothetical protein
MPIKTTPIKKKETLEDIPVRDVFTHELITPVEKRIPPCKHLNLVPIEISFIRITHPNGYKEQPKCEFYVGISLATAMRVRKYFCPECHEIIKAPSIYTEEKL